MPIEPRVSLVTLGVADVDRSESFYRALGWEVAVAADDGFRLFRTHGAWLALYPHASLRRLAGDPPAAGTGFRGVALAMNLDGRAEVDEAFSVALAAGATVLSSPEPTEWGGYTGCFADPDGHVWEVAHNPAWPIGPDGRPQVP
jgi:predicted lactoylglutathione lyase